MGNRGGSGEGGNGSGKRVAEHGVRKAVFPAAGLGTRMLPATKATPKEMLNVVDRPLIQYGVEEAVASGLSQIVLITAANKSAIEDHFDSSPELERLLERKGAQADLNELRRIQGLAEVISIRQKAALGLGHAVLLAKDVVGNEPFAVFLPDDIMHCPAEPCMAQLLAVYARYGRPVIAVERVPRADVSKYGILSVEEVGPRLFRILDMVEKPSIDEAPSDLAIMGRYVLTPDVSEKLEQTQPGAGGEIQLTDAIRQLLREGPVYAYHYDGRRFDCGSKLGYLQATLELALERPDLRDDVRALMRALAA